MKTIPLDVDERLIEAAEKRARKEHTTLQAQICPWHEEYVHDEDCAEEAMT